MFKKIISTLLMVGALFSASTRLLINVAQAADRNVSNIIPPGGRGGASCG